MFIECFIWERYVLRIFLYSTVLKNETATMFFLKKPSLVSTNAWLKFF